jgi:pimeloyl-ACP methyl ester carboxylesterase
MFGAPAPQAVQHLAVTLRSDGARRPCTGRIGGRCASGCGTFIREDEIPAAVQGTFLGDFRIRAQQAACAAWPVPPAGREFLDPVTSDVPVLLVSGERDPVTPPGNAERAARTLKNSLHVVMPDAGHGYDGIEGAQCANELTVKVVEAGTVQGLDTSCMARTKRPEFLLKPAV